ncbi:MAG TPA: glycosyltransferase family 4 protein, partial [Chthonomonadales bacterium]|nr:glycosyltransferase family 4 protein [Chthonomonadales bacterium]
MSITERVGKVQVWRPKNLLGDYAQAEGRSNKQLRIVMLSWEYPPRIVGGLARHVEELSWALAKIPEMEVHVVTCDFPGATAEEQVNGVSVHRVTPYSAPGGHKDFVHWVHQLNAAMRDRARALCADWLRDPAAPSVRLDGKALPERNRVLLHAHDWLAYFCAAELKHEFKLPLAATIHATEYGRNNGIHTEINRYINGIEWQLVYEAWRVIVCSDFMKGEVEHTLHAPWDKLDVIYNGI